MWRADGALWSDCDPLQMSERQRRARLDGLQRNVALDLAHDRQLQQLADEEVLIVLDVRHHNFKEVISLPGHQMAGNDLRPCAYVLFERQRARVGVALELHDDKDREALFL